MSEDIEANLLRDKKATLCGKIERLVGDLVPGGDDLKAVCDELVSPHPWQMDLAHVLVGAIRRDERFRIGKSFCSCTWNACVSSVSFDQGAKADELRVLEVLESRIRRDVAVRLLKIVNFVSWTNLLDLPVKLI